MDQLETRSAASFMRNEIKQQGFIFPEQEVWGESLFAFCLQARCYQGFVFVISLVLAVRQMPLLIQISHSLSKKEEWGTVVPVESFSFNQEIKAFPKIPSKCPLCTNCLMSYGCPSFNGSWDIKDFWLLW